MSIRDKLREATVGSPKNFKNKVININGEEIEVRQPSIRDRGQIMKSAGVASTQDVEEMDFARLQAYAVIYCTFVPGTDEKVFDEEDYEILLNAPAGSWVDKLSRPVMELMNVDPEDDAKN